MGLFFKHLGVNIIIAHQGLGRDAHKHFYSEEHTVWQWTLTQQGVLKKNPKYVGTALLTRHERSS